LLDNEPFIICLEASIKECYWNFFRIHWMQKLNNLLKFAHIHTMIYQEQCTAISLLTYLRLIPILLSIFILFFTVKGNLLIRNSEDDCNIVENVFEQPNQ